MKCMTDTQLKAVLKDLARNIEMASFDVDDSTVGTAMQRIANEIESLDVDSSIEFSF